MSDKIEKPTAKKVAKSTKVTKTAGKRNQKQRARTGIAEITNPGLRRLARRGGVKRISMESFDASRALLEEFLNTVVNDSIIMSESNKRKTVTSSDVSYSLRRNGHQLYGYN